MTTTNPNENNHIHDDKSFGVNMPLLQVLDRSDFLLLTPNDLGALDQDHSTDMLGTDTDFSDLDSLDLNTETTVFQWTGNTSVQENELPKLGNIFEFKDCIGVGGFCHIYRAFDTVLGREVAIKTLRKEFNVKYSWRDSFITEAKVTAILDHPNIIPIHGLYTDDKNQLHLVIKLIEGKNLREILMQSTKDYKDKPRNYVAKMERRLLVSRLEIFLKICDTIGFAHDKKILHRDLKPSNIMVGRFNEVYVMDWGIAEFRETKTHQKKKVFSGTPQYLAPEIMLKRPYDSRSDIYSLGVLLFNLVYLKAPFPQNSGIDKLFKMKVKGQTSPQKHAYGIRVSRTLNYIIRKAMAVKPEDRYQTVQALADDLHQFIYGDQGNGSFFKQIRHFFKAFFMS